MKAPLIIVALDFEYTEHALQFAAKLDPALCRLKVGKQLFTTSGPLLVEKLVRLGFDVFLDLKFHDIPATVAGACKSAANLGVWMINVHALGGRSMLLAAREALPKGTTQLIAVTLLTSIGTSDLQDIGIRKTPAQIVEQLAQLTHECGLDGIVCSALETQRIRSLLGNDFVLVTPGIRPTDHSNTDDQQRIATPSQAIKNGADYLVIGRPITQAPDPIAKLKQINKEISTMNSI